MQSWAKIEKFLDDGWLIDLSYKKKFNYTPLESALYTVDFITKNYPPPYTLMVSGGVDSQAMLYAWQVSGKPYKTFCGVYNNDLNQHDIENLKNFSKQNGLEISYYDVDLLYFLDKESSTYAHRYSCSSFQLCTHMKMMDMVKEGTVIYTGNFIQQRFGDYGVDKTAFNIYKYKLQSNKPIVPFFWLETGELAWSFEEILRTKDHDSNLSLKYKRKVDLYIKGGFPVIRQNNQTNGFEQVKKVFDNKIIDNDQYKKLRILGRSNISFRKIDLLHRNQFESKFYTKYNFKVTGKLCL